MRYVIICMIGYFIGSISIAALLSKAKKTDLRKNGTGNLGATNTFMVIGKGWGITVMLFDIAKAAASMLLAGYLFPEAETAEMLAGCGAVLGHIFPFYMKFKGGKGLAALCGMIITVDWKGFALILAVAVSLALIVNYAVAMPVTAAALFPILVWFRMRSVTHLLIALAASIAVIVKHLGNIRRAFGGSDWKIREYFRTHLKK